MALEKPGKLGGIFSPTLLPPCLIHSLTADGRDVAYYTLAV